MFGAVSGQEVARASVGLLPRAVVGRFALPAPTLGPLAGEGWCCSPITGSARPPTVRCTNSSKEDVLRPLAARAASRAVASASVLASAHTTRAVASAAATRIAPAAGG